MSIDLYQRREIAELDLARLSEVANPARAIGSLENGLACLRRLLLKRLHYEPERPLSIDSMMIPVSSFKEERDREEAAGEIDIYSAFIVADEAVNYGFVHAGIEEFRAWVIRLRLASQSPNIVAQRFAEYGEREPNERRLYFASVLERAMPEAMRAPLVIHRLFPRAVRLATALAFGDPLRAGEFRNAQALILPAIRDCHACHGGLLENGEECRECGNPLWTNHWLNAD